LLHASLPQAPWSALVTRLGYSFGFLIVIMARLQLFTENTITAVLPICAYPTARNFLAVVRVWGFVVAGNLIGTLIFAAFIRFTSALTPEYLASFAAVSGRILEVDFAHATAGGVVSGFLIACLVWVAPIVLTAEFWMILIVTYIIALGDFSHVVVGSAEAWFLVLNGSASLGRVFGTYVSGAFIGNVIGGAGLFTLLAYTQVFTELKEEKKVTEKEESENQDKSGKGDRSSPESHTENAE
ncbi:MAG TPA: formate/nitrite transporter family protein, partial [Pararhizobium sp.]|nr:formate/nitrite transporter family protein [Pararhizobium sp.]